MEYTLRVLSAFLLLLVINAQIENDNVNNEIEAGTELAKTIADKHFASAMGKRATIVAPSYIKTLQKKWTKTKRFNQVRKGVEPADKDVKNKYKEIALEDAKKILTFSKGHKNSYVANEIFQKLSEKFYWRNWFVGVYDKIDHEKDHEFWACKGDTTYHAGFNLLLASNSKSTKPLDRYDAYKYLKNVETSEVFFWFIKSSLNAKELLAKLKQIQDCRMYSAFGVIEKKANFHGSADSKRLVIAKKEGYEMFLFK